MSDGRDNIKLIRVREPRTDLKGESTYAILEGAQNATQYQTAATAYSNGQATFNIPVPSDRAVLDRVVAIKVPFTATITANPGALTAASQPIWNAGNDAVRAYPISAISGNVLANFNGVSVNVQPFLTTQPLARYNTYQRHYLGSRSIGPITTDPISTYRGAGGIGTGGAGDGVLNPLAIYSSASPGSSEPRGEYSGIRILTNQSGSVGSNTCTITGELYEMMPLFPFIDDEDEQSQGITNLKTFTMTFTWQNLSRIFSHSLAQNASAPYTLATNSWGDVQVQLQQPVLLSTFLTLKDSQRIPEVVHYPFSQFQVFPTSSGASALGVGASVELVSNSIQLQNIPRKIYIFAKMSDSVVLSGSNAAMPTYTDSFVPISNLSINWNNQTSLFGQASQAQLYTMSVSNGYSKSFNAFRGVTQVNSTVAGTAPYNVGLEGSVICMTMGKDIGLTGDEYSGKTGTYNLQVRATVTNTDPLNLNCKPDLYILTVTDGILAMSKNGAKIYTGVGDVDVSDVPLSKLSYKELTKVYGGSFWDTLKSILSPINQIAKDTKIGSKLVSAIPVVGPIASTLLSSLGYSDMSEMPEEVQAGVLAGLQAGMLAGGKQKGKKGGALVSRAQL